MYPFREIEKKWTKKWLDTNIYEPGLSKAKKPYYNLMMFPYPSAEGLHIGSVRTFTGVDVYGRYMRMQGYDVFEPIGLDGFGIHSENYALKVGKHPMEHAKASEKNFYRQLGYIGNGFAWEERLETYNPDYYKWTQWIFTQMFKHGLAYRAETSVNWCPSCKTVLADEQVLNGECERCGTTVTKRELEQWFFKITKYADKLLKNLEKIDWPEHIKTAQRNWIGKSEGAELSFPAPKYEKILLASTNKSKKERIERLLASVGIQTKVYTPDEAGIESAEAEEEGTLKQNALEKARAYAGKTDMPILGIDTGLFIKNEQIDPVKVKRNALGGRDEKKLTQKQISDLQVKYYQNIAKRNGGEVDAYWLDAFAFITPDGKERVITSKREVVLTDKIRGKVDEFFPVRSIYKPKATGKYVAEQSSEDELLELAPFTNALKKLLTEEIKVFTTRPDTIFGATYMVLAPEHELVGKLKDSIKNWKEVESYIKKAQSKTENERIVDAKTKTGVELKGVRAINPATKEEIPVWIADYVLASYGTGAIMAVPDHDERDREFAKKFKLPIVKTKLVDKWKITKAVGGKKEAHYHLRDWLISRQRYWGPPIPMVYCEKCGWQPVPEKDLPVMLPKIKNFRPTGTGEAPLATSPSFYKTKCPECGGPARRETDVSDTFLDSAWYFFRYIDPDNSVHAFGKARAKKWLPVDMYIGGAEHAVLHLLYARFLAMAFKDMGLIGFEEPFAKFRVNGLLTLGGAKMSKSKGNVIDPDDYVEKFGIDAIRLYLQFIAPLNQGAVWQDAGLMGAVRFLDRVWKLGAKPGVFTDGKSVSRWMHKSIKKITDDIPELKYNTAIAELMVVLNHLEKEKEVNRKDVEAFLLMLAPFAPFTTEELWEKLGNTYSIHRESWPAYGEKHLVEDTVKLIVQVNGKVRATLEVKKGITQKDAEKLALAKAAVARHLKGEPKKVIFVKDRLINFVV